MNIDSGGGRRRPPKRSPHVPSAVAGALAPQPQQQPGGQPVQPFDLNTDPILQQIQAASARSVADAQSAELAGRKGALVDFGYDPGLSDLYPDQSTQQASQGNPYSTLANLLYQHQQTGQGLDENYNQQNLFYSSARAKALTDEERRYGQQKYDSMKGLRGQLAGLAGALLATQNGAAATNAQGASDAYARYQPSAVAAQTAAPAPPPPGGIGAGMGGGGGSTSGINVVPDLAPNAPHIGANGQVVVPTVQMPTLTPKAGYTTDTYTTRFDPLLAALGNSKRGKIGGGL